MRSEAKFRDFLTKTFKSPKTGKPFSSKVAGDMISRCRRIERVLGVQLSSRTLLKKGAYEEITQVVKRNASMFGVSPSRPYAYNQSLYALRQYKCYLEWEANR